MIVEFVLALATLLATGIEAAYVPTDDGGGEYLVRVEPDLVETPPPTRSPATCPPTRATCGG